MEMMEVNNNVEISDIVIKRSIYTNTVNLECNK